MVKSYKGLILVLLGIAFAGFAGHWASTWETGASVAPSQPKDETENLRGGGKTLGSFEQKGSMPGAAKSAEVAGASETNPQPKVKPVSSEVAKNIEKRMEIDLRKRVVVDISKAAFFKGLPPEKQKEVLDVLTQAEGTKMKLIMDAGRERRPPPKQQMDELKRETDDAVRGAVGEATFSEYEKHAANRPHRAVVNVMNQSLAEPLSDESSDALVQILAEEMKKGRVDGEPSGDPQSIINGIAERSVSRAAEVLTPEQVEALRGSFDRLTRRPQAKK